MQNSVDVDDVVLRAQRHWMEDGLAEIMLGLLFALLAGSALARMLMPRWLSLDLLTSALTVAGALGLSWGLKKMKARIAFPRSGYVALTEPSKMSRAFVFVGIAVVGTVFSLFFYAGWNAAAVPAVTAVFALALIGPGIQTKLLRMQWEGVLVLVFGAYLYWFTDLNGSKGVLTLMLALGVCMATVGALQLRRFLKTNPSAQETEA